MMWGKFSKRWQIILATLFSILLVYGAYALARTGGFEVAQASTETELLKAIATKDSDGDGLPDWEEALYGTNPSLSDSRNLGMTDGEAVSKGLIVPLSDTQLQALGSTATSTSNFDYKAEGLPEPTTGTITDGFAKAFFTLYIAAKNENGGNELSADEISGLASQAMDQLSSTITPAPNFRTVHDLKLAASGTESMKAFAASAEAVLIQNATTSNKTDLEYFQLVIQNHDTNAVESLLALSTQYRNTASGLAALSVPLELAEQDTAIINALMRLGQIYGDFARFDQDPLTAMFALQQYKDSELAAEQAFTALASIYAREGVVLPAETPGAVFVNLMYTLPTP